MMVTQMVKRFHAFVESKVSYLDHHSPLSESVMNWLNHLAEVKEAIQIWAVHVICNMLVFYILTRFPQHVRSILIVT
jgi:hypothetical protein